MVARPIERARHGELLAKNDRENGYDQVCSDRGAVYPRPKASSDDLTQAFAGWARRRFFFSLTRLALRHEPGPVARRAPTLLAPERDLRLSQRRRRQPPLAQHPAIEKAHQLRRGLIVNIPQTDQHARRPGVHKTPCQPDQPFATDANSSYQFPAARREHAGTFRRRAWSGKSATGRRRFRVRLNGPTRAFAPPGRLAPRYSLRLCPVGMRGPAQYAQA